MIRFWIEVVIDLTMTTRGKITSLSGNLHCWFGLFEYSTKDASYSKKLFQNYNKRQNRFSGSIGDDTIQDAFSKYVAFAGLNLAVNSMWAKKSFANTTLGHLQLPVEQVLATTGHKTEKTLRKYYHLPGGTPMELDWTPTTGLERL